MPSDPAVTTAQQTDGGHAVRELINLTLFDDLPVPAPVAKSRRPTDRVRHPVHVAGFQPTNRRLSALSKKVWLWILSHSLLEPPENTPTGTPVWRSPLQQLETDLQFNSKNRRVLTEAISGLQETLVQWSNVAGVEWASTQLLGSVQLLRGTDGRTYLRWSLPELLLTQIQANRHYYLSSWQIVRDARRYATIAMYEIAERYRTNPSHLTHRMPWQQWRAVLTGTPQDPKGVKNVGKAGAGDVYRYFLRDTIRPMLAELHQLQGELSVELLETVGATREVEQLQFKILPKTKPALPRSPTPRESSDPHFDQQVEQQLIEVGFHAPQAERLVDRYTAHACSKAMHVAAASRNRIENVPGFITSLLDKEATARARLAGEANEAGNESTRPGLGEAPVDPQSPAPSFQAGVPAQQDEPAPTPTRQELVQWFAQLPPDNREGVVRRFELDGQSLEGVRHLWDAQRELVVTGDLAGVHHLVRLMFVTWLKKARRSSDY